MYEWNFSSENNPNYNFKPSIILDNIEGFFGYDSIVQAIQNIINKNNDKTIVIDIPFYFSVQEIYECLISKLNIETKIDVSNYLLDLATIQTLENHFLTKHKVNGLYSTLNYPEFYSDIPKDDLPKFKLLYGVGASSIVEGDILISIFTTDYNARKAFYSMKSVWTNINDEVNSSILEKRFEFLELPMYDRHRFESLTRIDFQLYMGETPVLIASNKYLDIARSVLKQPFQLTPYFESNCWGGGKWFTDVLGAKDLPESGTSFLYTGHLEKQSLKIVAENGELDIPGKDLIYYLKSNLLGNILYYQFGLRCPLNVLLVDTIKGQNTSLQVHPNAYYNQNYLNYPYAHNEGYYILNTTDDSKVYMGIKEEIEIDDFIKALKDAQITQQLNVEDYVYAYSVKPHDFFFLPGGCVHAFGANTTMLEIDSTASTTFKLWDWNRVGGDGKPRPIDIELGERVIEPLFGGKWSCEHLLSNKEIDNISGNETRKIGTMQYEPIEVYKHWIQKEIDLETNDQINIVVLTEGKEAVIESLDRSFEPFPIHYLEATFIPAAIKGFRIRNIDKDHNIALVQIYKEKEK